MGEYNYGTAKTRVMINLDLSYLFSALCNVSGLDIDVDGIECELNGDSIYLDIPTRVDVKTYYDPGKRWMSNGDPGDPPEYDVEPTYDWKAIKEIEDKENISVGIEIDEDLDDIEEDDIEENFDDSDYDQPDW